MIEVVPYRAIWPDEYRKAAAGLRRVLGDLVVALHHIGSTAVPGLAAKDIIDIQLSVADLGVALEARLEPLGLVLAKPICDHCPAGLLLPPVELEKRMFKATGRAVNLHIRQSGRFNHRYPVLVRDFLRAEPVAAQAYGEIKQQLAQRFPDDENAYYDIKDPVSDMVFLAAGIWADQQGWVLPPSDS